MTSIHTWTLWQRMPPRYQLTSRFYDEDAEDLPVSVTPEKLPSARSSSSRPTSGLLRQHGHTHASTWRPPSGSNTPRKPTHDTNQKDENGNFMVKSNAQSHPEPSTNYAPGSSYTTKFSFPKRKSDYINNFQKQKRVNSARRRLAESPPSPALGITRSTNLDSPRAQTAPVFPVTSPDNNSVQNIKFTCDTRDVVTPKKSQRKAETTKVNLFEFDDARSISTTSSGEQKTFDKHQTPKKYVIQDTSRSTLYIDRGKVISFGKSRHDLTQLLKTQSLRRDRNRSFFSELRRDYLTHPKYDINRNKDKRENDPRRVAYERIDYNRKVENILNYYSDDAGTRSPSPPNSRSSSRYRVRSPKGGRYKGLSLTVSAPSRPPSRAESPVPEKVDGYGDFIKLNKQSKLYDRKFYLRTPVLKHDGCTEKELENCRCSICRLELQLSIVTGVNKAMFHNESQSKGEHTDINTENDISDIVNNGSCIIDDTTNGGRSVNDAKNKKVDKLKVTFQQPEATEPVLEQHTLTISCTLPEVRDLPQSEMASESGFESSRTVVSETKTDITRDS